MTRKRSPSSSSAMRFPTRWMRTTCLPTASTIGGSNVRSTKGEARRTAWMGWRRMRASSASMYAVMSGSSGTQLDQRAHLVQGLHADSQHRPAAVIAAPFEGGGVEDGVQRQVDAGAQLQLDPGGGGRSLRQPHDVPPEAAGLLHVRHLQRHPGELVHGAAM